MKANFGYREQQYIITDFLLQCVRRAPLIMTHTLTAFMELMDHGIVSWENLSSVFIKKVRIGSRSQSKCVTVLRYHIAYVKHVCDCVCVCICAQIAGFVNAKVMDTSIQQVSLDILASMVLSSSSLFHQIREEITLERLISHLQVYVQSHTHTRTHCLQSSSAAEDSVVFQSLHLASRQASSCSK